MAHYIGVFGVYLFVVLDTGRQHNAGNYYYRYSYNYEQGTEAENKTYDRAGQALFFF